MSWCKIISNAKLQDAYFSGDFFGTIIEISGSGGDEKFYI